MYDVKPKENTSDINPTHVSEVMPQVLDRIFSAFLNRSFDEQKAA